MTGAAIVLLGCRHRHSRVDHQPLRHRDRLRLRRDPISDGLIGRLVILVVGLAIGIFFVMRYAARVKTDPAGSIVHDMKG